MRVITGWSIAIAIAASACAAPYDHSHEALDALLKTYVSGGSMDYAGLKQQRDDLDAYLADAGTVALAEFQAWTRNEQLAFLLNVYNAATLQVVVEAYPVDSIRSIEGARTREVVALFGKRIALETLENKLIMKNYADPRLYFAMENGAKGGAPLRAEAYQGARLEAQLLEQTRIFLRKTDSNRVDSEARLVWLSPVFQWHGDDFTRDAGSVLNFVAPLMGLDDVSMYTVQFTEYDWALNDRKGTR
jgi:hypothetical protein